MLTKQQRFAELHPDTFFLTSEHPKELEGFMKDRGWLAADEEVLQVEKPGEGNMNYVLRVKTNRQSLIIKQSRPWVEKYSQIEAPIGRIIVEAQFYDALSEVPTLSQYIPALKGFRAESLVMLVEDLGEASDFTKCYQKGETLTEAELSDLVQFLSDLHRLDVRAFREPFPDNLALRRLNAEHIFTYPYLADNGLDLDTIQEGLQALSGLYRQDRELKAEIDRLGDIYLSEGSTLLHGDYYPGSWLRTAQGTRIIDPEFSFVGFAEFDLGVMVAHLLMAQLDESLIRNSLAQYEPATGFNHALFAGFCGAEIIRRLIGLAQLPLDLTLSERDALLQRAASFVKTPASNPYLKPEPDGKHSRLNKEV
jgi:5-methylthioribose kinase